MTTFWDTSAVLALVYVEPRTAEAVQARSRSTVQYAWRWMAVEAQAGLARRGARPVEWDNLRAILDAFAYMDLTPEQTASVGRANREWRLRASDAGHLYSFQQASLVFPDIQLICFDEEIVAVARRLRLSVWVPVAEGDLTGGTVVREKRPEYGGRTRQKRAAHR